MTTKHWFEFANLMKQHRVSGDTDIKVYKTQSEMGGEIASNKYISLINKARQQRLSIREFSQRNRIPEGGYLMLEKVSDLLVEHKKQLDVYDYTGSIEFIVEEDVEIPKLKVVIVDEAQDLTKLQWALVKKFVDKADRVYVAGDDDQEIYEWAGAEALYFKNLKGKSRVLDKSYRVPRNIAEKSRRLIERIPKHLREQKDW